MISQVKIVFVRGGELLQQGAILTLDSVYLAGKLSSKVPSYITKGALFGLSASSILSMPFQCSLLKKTAVDFIHARKTKEHQVMLASSLKTIYIATGIFLGTINFIAAACGLFSKEAIQTKLYKMMIPLGESSIALGALLALTNLYFYRLVLNNKTEVVDLYQKALSLLNPNMIESQENVLEDAATLSSRLRFCMDKDTLADLIRDYNAEQSEILSDLTRKNIETQQNIALKGGVILSLIGYILMGIEKYYTPNSIESAIINESMALLYACLTAFQLVKEVRQRGAIANTATAPLLYA